MAPVFSFLLAVSPYFPQSISQLQKLTYTMRIDAEPLTAVYESINFVLGVEICVS